MSYLSFENYINQPGIILKWSRNPYHTWYMYYKVDMN